MSCVSSPQNVKIFLGQALWTSVSEILFRSHYHPYQAWAVYSERPVCNQYNTMADFFQEFIVMHEDKAYLLFWGEND